MRLSFSHYDVTVTIEHERDDLTVDDFLELVEDLARAAGYNIRPGEFQWIQQEIGHDQHLDSRRQPA